jgi:hypothetical protein
MTKLSAGLLTVATVVALSVPVGAQRATHAPVQRTLLAPIQRPTQRPDQRAIHVQPPANSVVRRSRLAAPVPTPSGPRAFPSDSTSRATERAEYGLRLGPRRPSSVVQGARPPQP